MQRTSAGISEARGSDKFRLVCTSPDLLLEPGRGEPVARFHHKEIQPRRMVIDSLNHLGDVSSRGGDMRKEAYRVLNYVKTKGISPIASGRHSSLLDRLSASLMSERASWSTVFYS